MKLETSILPRKDGRITVQCDDGTKVVFSADSDGIMTGEVTHLPTVARLLALGTYFPADEEDHAAASTLLTSQTKADDDGDGDDEADDEREGDDLDGLPMEANTPPSALPKGVRKKKSDAAG
jgi:hypothetical protein